MDLISETERQVNNDVGNVATVKKYYDETKAVMGQGKQREALKGRSKVGG